MDLEKIQELNEASDIEIDDERLIRDLRTMQFRFQGPDSIIAKQARIRILQLLHKNIDLINEVSEAKHEAEKFRVDYFKAREDGIRLEHHRQNSPDFGGPGGV